MSTAHAHDGAAHDPVGKLLDLTVFAPLGLALAAREDLAGFADRGRTAITNRVMLARFVSQMALQQARREVERRLANRGTSADTSTTGSGTVTTASTTTAPDGTASGRATTTAATSDTETLPIAGYESLPAANVVQRLATLGPDEIEAVRVYEQGHRARRTVLAKIAQLQGR